MKALANCVMLVMYGAVNAVGYAQCTDAAIQQTQKQTAVALPEYSTQIQLARQAFLEIYDHGLFGEFRLPRKQQSRETTWNVDCGSREWESCMG